MKLEFSGQIFEKKKNAKIWNFLKIRPLAAEFFLADGGWMDRRTFGAP